VVDVNDLEAKHVGRGLLSWEQVSRGKDAKEMIKFFKGISKQMKKIKKNI
jgi:hypothetical protein